MTKDVMLTISGLQSIFQDDDSPGEPMEMVAPASFFEKNGKYYVLYEELDDTETALTKNTIKIAPNSVEVIRHGSVHSHMVFEVDQTNTSNYQTPFGEFQLGVTATNLHLEAREEKIHVDLDYSLAVNCEPMAECRLSLSVTPRTREAFQLL